VLTLFREAKDGGDLNERVERYRGEGEVGVTRVSAEAWGRGYTGLGPLQKCHLEVKGEGSVMLIRLFTKALSKTLMVIIKRLNW
jgi:hypothetical protein